MSLTTVVLYLLLLTTVTWYEAGGLTEQEILLECCQAWSCTTNSNFNPPWTSRTDPCSGGWYGIVCDSSGQVTRVYANESGIIGTLPTALGNLSNLRYLLATMSSQESFQIN